MKNKQIPVIEMYPSIQGEGIYVGEPCIFLRLGGCNFHCECCDSKFSWEDKKNLKYPDDIARDLRKMINDTSLETVVITGGEPLLYAKEIQEIINIRKRLYGIVFRVETNGSVYHYLPEIDFWSISPKLDKMNTDYCYNLRKLIREYGEMCQVKFLIQKKADIRVISSIFGFIPEDVPIILQPMWKKGISYLKSSRLVVKYTLDQIKKDCPLLISHNIRVIPQVHRLIWRNKRSV